MRNRVLAVVLSLTGAVMGSRGSFADERVDFQKEIRPILSQYCFHCHGPDAETREAELRLDTKDGLSHVTGDGVKSELLRRVTTSDSDERMPPPETKKRLSKEQVAKLQRWLEGGAQWDQHWAYVPPKMTRIPVVKNQGWVRNWVDRYVLAQLEARGIAPSKMADRITLIRRLSFDLTGLPPTPEDVRRFVSDTNDDAYERLVDRLLSQPSFGERMGAYWLDLTRFANTVGYHGDQDHNISPYRDYVIDAFNRNMSFDQFTREQLAGDLLPNSGPDQKIATGYNRMLQTSHEGGVQAKEYLAIYAADRVRNVSSVWLGGTLGCAQCHDHKYDPYTTKDFYSMVAFFADIDESQHFKTGSNSLPTKRAPELALLTRHERTQVEILEAQIAEGRACGLDEDQIKALEARKKRIEKAARQSMITVSVKPRAIRVLPRGNWLDDSGEIVEPAIPSFMGQLELGRRANRLDLANWLVDEEKGIGLLTARVMANRFWYLFFGDGLSPSLDDFGGQGQAPDHPELLDALARRYVANGWNTKRLVREIVTSAAYRQRSDERDDLREIDPKNRLFARQSSWRLPAEMVRDNSLATSGLLVYELGGQSVKPYQPQGYYRHLNFPKRAYKHHVDHQQWRRGVYVHWQRQFLHPMMRAFDAPSREECTAKRSRSNTPLAALTLMNDPTFVEAARVFAENWVRLAVETDEQRLADGFEKVLSRRPDVEESSLLLKYLAKCRQKYRDDPAAAEKVLQVGLSQPAAQAPAERQELAAWMSVARAMMNLRESVQRN